MYFMPCESKPRCSILVPAYEYSEGISRILDSLNFIEASSFEIIISDDSPSDVIEKLVKLHDLSSRGIVKYHRNLPGLGAVKNWNHLLSCADSEVLVLLHHDEFFMNPYDFYRAVNEISCGRADVVVGKAKLARNTGQRLVTHFPLFLSELLIKKIPEYIYLRNFIGPVSCLIFRKSCSVFFDVNLRWLVDVDFYYRLTLRTKKWLFLDYHSICSLTNRPTSISAEIRNDLQSIYNAECYYLCENRSLKLLHYTSSSLLFKGVEIFVWASFRSVWNIIRFFR